MMQEATRACPLCDGQVLTRCTAIANVLEFRCEHGCRFRATMPALLAWEILARWSNQAWLERRRYLAEMCRHRHQTLTNYTWARAADTWRDRSQEEKHPQRLLCRCLADDHGSHSYRACSAEGTRPSGLCEECDDMPTCTAQEMRTEGSALPMPIV